MNKSNLPEILICECGSVEHQIIIRIDEEENVAYCAIHLVHYGFWKRVKAGFKYIFGYKCKYGQWDEFIFSQDHVNQLRELSEFLINKNKK